jgi:S-adenosylmethionine-diacylgycerolhomoserine-N-methlytransferase
MEPKRIDYQPNATWASDLQVLKSMIFADVKGDTQQERLESFYVTQADLYDSYRCRMLHGRFPMIQAMPAPKNGVWVDMGGGTGSNLEFFGDKLIHWGKVVVLDLCPSLVTTAQKRVTARGWDSFVTVVLGDACDEKCVGMPAAGKMKQSNI